MSRIEASYPLAPMQQGMLFHSLYEQSGVYIEQMICSLQEPLNVAAFKQSWQRVVQRHQVLRTSFDWDDSAEPIQRVYKEVELPWEEQDWRGMPGDQQERLLQEYLESDRVLGFDLAEPSSKMRLAIFQLAEADYKLVWTFYHALLDGRGYLIVLKEVFAIYENLCGKAEEDWEKPKILEELEKRRPYRDYIDWLQNKTRTDAENAEQFWRQKLSGFAVPTQLTGTRELEPRSYKTQEVRLSVASTSALQSLAEEHQLTLNTLVQGAWALLLSRYSGEEDVVFGATKTFRGSSVVAGMQSMVGLLINTLPVRVWAKPDSLLLPWLNSLRSQWVALREYEHTPLVKIQEWSEVPPGIALFESIVIFENYQVNEALRSQGGNWKLREFQLLEQINYPLCLCAYAGSDLLLKITYDRSQFEDRAIARMLGHLETLLEGMAANPNQRLGDVPLLTAAERHQLLIEWNDTHREYASDCVHQLFEKQVEQNPDAIAVVCGDKQLTYRELNARANQLASYLRSLGVCPEKLVGICMERSLEMAVGRLGILKAGGAYAPLDPVYPKERLALMVEGSQVSVLLTKERWLGNLPKYQGPIVCLDADWEKIAPESSDNLDSGVTPENLIYVIHTSGSTGKPKGAGVYHRGFTNLVNWFATEFQFTKSDRVLLTSSLSFDLTQKNIFAPLIVGGTLHLFDCQIYDPEKICQSVGEAAVTWLNCTPSAFYPLVAQSERGSFVNLKSLRYVFLGGEPISLSILKTWLDSPNCNAKIVNSYGPTECTDVCAFYVLERPEEFADRAIPIGKPIFNTQLLVLDQNLQLLPVGKVGELCVGGEGVGPGYINNAEMTDRKFLPNAYSEEAEARLYKTGDLVRYAADGNIEFIGRIDHQVKIRGFRIELGEVEALLAKHPGVREVLVVAREDSPGNKSLVAYLIPHQDLEERLTTSKLHRYLKEKLPDYSIPSAFVMLEAFPLTPSGKVDRRALPAPEALRPELDARDVLPQTEAERLIAEVWQEVLQLERVGIHDNFAELGGHSLLMVRVHHKLKKIFIFSEGQKLTMVEMFQYPTIHALAERLSPEAQETSAIARPFRVNIRKERMRSRLAPRIQKKHFS